VKDIIAFIGAESKVGTSLISRTIAEKFAEQGYSVLLINCSDDYAYMQSTSSSIDEVRVQLLSNVLHFNEIKQNCEYIEENFLQIGGPKKYKDEWQPQEMQLLISKLEPYFDYIFLDVGENLLEGAAVGGVTASTKRFIVLTQQESSIKKCQEKINIIKKIKCNIDALILNKFILHSKLPEIFDIEQSLNIEIRSVIPYMETIMAWEMEKLRKPMKGFINLIEIKELREFIKGVKEKESSIKKFFIFNFINKMFNTNRKE
jgi:CO dehydrogenase nickel-insertion accessory protein CooC1